MLVPKDKGGASLVWKGRVSRKGGVNKGEANIDVHRQRWYFQGVKGDIEWGRAQAWLREGVKIILGTGPLRACCVLPSSPKGLCLAGEDTRERECG